MALIHSQRCSLSLSVSNPRVLWPTSSPVHKADEGTPEEGQEEGAGGIQEGEPGFHQ